MVPKGLCPTRQAWEKQRQIFNLSKAKRDFCRCWSEAQETKNPLLVQETQSKATAQRCQEQPRHCPGLSLSPPSLWGEHSPQQLHRAELSTQSCCTHQKQPGKHSSKEVNGQGLLLKETAFLTGGSNVLLMQKIIFVSSKKEPLPVLWLIPLANAKEKNYSNR